MQIKNSIFFFQAEDGIRDDLVTGVQTCALPIYVAGEVAVELAPQGVVRPARGDAPDVRRERPVGLHALRSEERRVGKECRSRWFADNSKNKEDGVELYRLM